MAVAIVPMAKEFGWAPGVQVGPSHSPVLSNVSS